MKLKFKNMVRKVQAEVVEQPEGRRNSDVARRNSRTFDSEAAVASLKVKRIQQLARAADTEDTDASVRTVLSIAKHQQVEMKALRKQNAMLEEKLDRCLKLLGPTEADGARGRRTSNAGGANGGRMTPRLEGGRMTPRMDLLDDDEDDIETFTFSPDLVTSNREIRSRPGSPGRGESATGSTQLDA